MYSILYYLPVIYELFYSGIKFDLLIVKLNLLYIVYCIYCIVNLNCKSKSKSLQPFPVIPSTTIIIYCLI